MFHNWIVTLARCSGTFRARVNPLGRQPKKRSRSNKLRLAIRIVGLAVASILVGALPAGAAGVGGKATRSPSPDSTGTLHPAASAVLGPLAGILGSLPGTHLLPSTKWPGYLLASNGGEVGSYGGSPFKGSLRGSTLHAPVVGIAATPDGQGYWLVGDDGGVFAFGDAPFLGSIAGTTLNQNMVGIVADPNGQGYWLVGADGGVFAFGQAPFYGSVASTALSQPVVGMTATPDGKGYWLVGADGGVFAFGDALFYGSLAGQSLTQPVVGMTATPDGRGYWLVGADGGVFAFGDALYYGSLAGRSLSQPVVGMAATPDGRGYWLVAADGGTFSFGSAPFRGSASGDVPTGQSITGLIADPGSQSRIESSGDFINPVTSSYPPYDHGAKGFDISYPQCHKPYPRQSAVAVVGVNDGRAFTTNPCFASEARWAGPNLSAYINVNSPQGSDSDQWDQGPDGSCATSDPGCESYNFGFNTAQRSISFVRSVGYDPHTWWLDVETSNYWTTDTSANDEVIAGALAAISQAGDAAAIYGTDYQWGVIAGNYVPNVPAWYATGVSTYYPQDWCTQSSFAGGPVYLVQGRAGTFDGAYSC